MLFSIIVPIYKVEDYIENCIKSVLNQTYSEFELILVDDGSPDNCGKICDEYQQRDSRIKVIHKENGGLVSARQEGIKKAQGEYVINLDGDDALDSATLEKSYEIIKSTNADIISYDYFKIENDIKIGSLECFLPEGLYDEVKVKDIILPSVLTNENMKHIIYFLAGKVIKRSILTDCQLSVPQNISMGEDLCCSIPCFFKAKSVYISRFQPYFYTIRCNSMTTSFNAVQIDKLDNVYKVLSKNYGENYYLKKQIPRYCIYMFFAILADAAEGKHFKALPEIIKKLKMSSFAGEFEYAEFSDISAKSKISLYLIKKRKIKFAFYFLYFCKLLKSLFERR